MAVYISDANGNLNKVASNGYMKDQFVETLYGQNLTTGQRTAARENISRDTNPDFVYSGLVGSDESSNVTGWYLIGTVETMGAYNDFDATLSFNYTYHTNTGPADAIAVLHVRTGASAALEYASLKIISSNRLWNGTDYQVALTITTSNNSTVVNLYGYIPYQYMWLRTTILSQSSRSNIDKRLILESKNGTRAYASMPSGTVYASTDGMKPFGTYSSETISNNSNKTSPITGYAKIVPINGLTAMSWMSLGVSSGVSSVIDNQPRGAYPQVFIPVSRGETVFWSWGGHTGQMTLTFIQGSA